jgi:hypothetical protein
MYRLLFASVQLHVLRKSLICIGPVIGLSIAVVLLGVRTRRCLICDLIYYDHLGSQTSILGHASMPCRSVGCAFIPFHAVKVYEQRCGFGLIRRQPLTHVPSNQNRFRSSGHSKQSAPVYWQARRQACCVAWLEAASNHTPKLNLGQFCGRIIMTCAACTKSMRRYRLPRFVMRPRVVRPPVLC